MVTTALRPVMSVPLDRTLKEPNHLLPEDPTVGSDDPTRAGFSEMPYPEVHRSGGDGLTATVTELDTGIATGTSCSDRLGAAELQGGEDHGFSRTLRIVPWTDPLIDRLGHDPRSLYVETYWLGILGPSTTWLLRLVAHRLDAHPDGFDLDLSETARALGLGTGAGKRSTFARTLKRCHSFGMARAHGPEAMAVRKKLPSLPQRHLVRLPHYLQEQHRQWMVEQENLPPIEQLRRHAKKLALSLIDLGETDETVEGELLSWGVHPSLAKEATDWARQRQQVVVS